MRDKDTQRHYAYEAMQIMLLLAILLFITRLWPILLLVILGIFIAALRLLFLGSKKVDTTEPVLVLPEPVKHYEPTEKDMQAMAYHLIQQRVTQILHQKYPDARWVWENPHAKENILSDQKVYVLLNRAGGYRRGLVLIRNLQVLDVIFDAVSEPQKPTPAPPVKNPPTPPKKDPPVPAEESDEEPEIPEDFGLIAFQWVEANVLALNERINEAIGKREIALLIPASELPVKDSWEEICKELSRNEVTGARCCQNGIQIEFEE